MSEPADRDGMLRALERVMVLANTWRTVAKTEMKRGLDMPDTEETIGLHIQARARAQMAREHAYALFAAIDGATETS